MGRRRRREPWRTVEVVSRDRTRIRMRYSGELEYEQRDERLSRRGNKQGGKENLGMTPHF